jgi:hypothetical protein
MKRQFEKGTRVFAKANLYNSSGTIIRAHRGEELIVLDTPFPGFLLVRGAGYQFIALAENFSYRRPKGS